MTPEKLSLLLGASNAGTEFLMTFHPCWEESAPNNSIRIYVASLFETEVTLSIPGKGILRQKTTVPNGVIEFILSPLEALAYSKGSGVSPIKPLPEQVWEGIAINIKSDDPIICYGVVRFQYTSDGYLALPINHLGTKYQVASYADTTNNRSQFLPSYTSILGIHDQTKVTFTLGGGDMMMVPKFNGDTLRAGETMQRYLNKGDVWLIPGMGPFNDLTGSIIEADKPIGVISGSFCSYIPSHIEACDYIIEQELPIESWGNTYLVYPIYERKKFPIVKIFAAENNTQVLVDGLPLFTIQNAGGLLGPGYIETRAGTAPQPKPVVISSDKPINVVLFNPGSADDGVSTDPFQMQVFPVELYSNDVIFNTPGVYGSLGFKSNFLHLIYLATEDANIPDDLMFGEYNPEGVEWQKVSAIFISEILKFDYKNKDGRYYYGATIKLEKDGVYRVKASDPIAVYAYGYDSWDSYGFAAAGNIMDLKFENHKTPPMVVYQMDDFGNITGSVMDLGSPINSINKASDIIQNKSEASGLSYVRIIHQYSTNYKLINDEFIPGIDKSTGFKLEVIDFLKSAKAVFVASDRRSNDTVLVFMYQPKGFPNITSVSTDFGLLKSGHESVLEFDLINETSSETLPIKTLILEYEDSQFEITNNVISGQVLKPGASHKFGIKFKAQQFNPDKIDEIEGVFKNRIGYQLMSGSQILLTEIRAEVANPIIRISDLNFSAREVGSKSSNEKISISNMGIISLNIFKFEISGDTVFKFELPSVSNDNPLVIESGMEYDLNVTFEPNEPRQFIGKLKVISDAYHIKDEATLIGLAYPSSIDEFGFPVDEIKVITEGGQVKIISEYDFMVNSAEIYDINGKMVLSVSSEMASGSFAIPIGNISQGVYIINMKVKDKWISKKFII